MNFRLLSISSMYPGYLKSFNDKHPDIDKLSYNDHLKLLVQESTEFAASYTRHFNKLGIQADCIITNETKLQLKWASENSINAEKEILFSQVSFFKPEVLWIENLNAVSKEFLVNIRQQVKSIKLILAYHCAPFNPRITASIAGVDYIVTCTPGLKNELENQGKKAFLVYHGFDSDLLAGMNTENEICTNELIFSGSLIPGGDFHNERIKMLEHILKNNIRLDLYINTENRSKILAKQLIYLTGSLLNKLNLNKLKDSFKILEYGKTWVNMYPDIILKAKKPPVFGIDMYNLFRHSRIVLNFHIGVAGEYAGNMRMFEVTGSGSCLLTDNKKNIRDLFEPDSEVVVYDNRDECVEKILWLLEHEEERKKIALAGNKRTLQTHTVARRCESVIEIINSILKS